MINNRLFPIAEAQGEAEFVKYLPAHGSISMQARATAARAGAFNGHWDVVKAVLASGVISYEHMDHVIQDALKGGMVILQSFQKKKFFEILIERIF